MIIDCRQCLAEHDKLNPIILEGISITKTQIVMTFTHRSHLHKITIVIPCDYTHHVHNYLTAYLVMMHWPFNFL
jgi:hypothetical protein